MKYTTLLFDLDETLFDFLKSEEYAACKGLLFRQCKTGIVNIDNKHADMVLSGHTCELETYGLHPNASLYADNNI